MELSGKVPHDLIRKFFSPEILEVLLSPFAFKPRLNIVWALRLPTPSFQEGQPKHAEGCTAAFKEIGNGFALTILLANSLCLQVLIIL